MALRATGLPCLCWSPAPSRRAAAHGLQGDGEEVLAYCFDVVLNPYVVSGTEVPAEEALALQGLTSMKNLIPLCWNYKVCISRESSVTLQHLNWPEAWCGGLALFQCFSNKYTLPE